VGFHKFSARRQRLWSSDHRVIFISLKKAADEYLDKNLLEQLLAEESESANIREGLRRSVITKMGLRDQPILDKYQDEIFRLPLSSQLLILGSPGTGKTTTLIRRLGQKLDSEFLIEDERNVVTALSKTGSTPHDQSWMLFTPTELLKQYVKEAFARESIPASDRRISTWSDYRRQLSRNVLGVLRTPSSKGAFVLKETVVSLTSDTEEQTVALYTDFNEWHSTAFIEDIRLAAQELSTDSVNAISELGQRLLSIVQRARANSLSPIFTALSAESNGVQSMISRMKEVTDEKIRGVLNLQLNRNNNFLDELAKFIDGLREAQSVDDDDQEDEEPDEDEDASQPKMGRAAAVTAFIRAVRGQARAQAKNRSLERQREMDESSTG